MAVQFPLLMFSRPHYQPEFKTPKVAYCIISLITVYSFTFAVNAFGKKTQFTLIINRTRWQSHSASIPFSDLQCP